MEETCLCEYPCSGLPSHQRFQEVHVRMGSWLLHFQANETANKTSHQSKSGNFPHLVYIFLDGVNGVAGSLGLAIQADALVLPSMLMSLGA